MLGKLLSGFCQAVPRFGTIFNGGSSAIEAVAGANWSLVPVRTRVRYPFPVARETKRVKVHGWKTRMSTLQGRKIIMRRILKGRHCLSH